MINFRVFFFGLVLLPTSFAFGNGDPADVDTSYAMRCDAIYRPPGCVTGLVDGDINAKDLMEIQVGIGLERDSSNIRKIERVVIQVDRPTVRSRSGSGTLETSDVAASSSEGVGNGAGSVAQIDGESSDSKSKFGDLNGTGLQGPEGSGGQQQPQLASYQTQSGGVKAGGYLYSDDDSSGTDTQAIAAPGENSSGTLASTFSPEQAVKANLASADTGRGEDGGIGARGLASSGGKPNFGETEAGTPSSKGSGNGENPITAGLKSLASALGKVGNAMGLGDLFGFGSSKPGEDQYAHFDKNGQRVFLDKNGQLNKNLLIDEYNNRRPASALEFGATNEPIFEGMCSHYEAYARKNRIRYDRIGCRSF